MPPHSLFSTPTRPTTPTHLPQQLRCSSQRPHRRQQPSSHPGPPLCARHVRGPALDRGRKLVAVQGVRRERRGVAPQPRVLEQRRSVGVLACREGGREGVQAGCWAAGGCCPRPLSANTHPTAKQHQTIKHPTTQASLTSGAQQRHAQQRVPHARCVGGDDLGSLHKQCARGAVQRWRARAAAAAGRAQLVLQPACKGHAQRAKRVAVVPVGARSQGGGAGVSRRGAQR